jgi:hypothetical protein
MIPPALGRAVLVGRLARISHPQGAYVPKTGQTGQTAQPIENPWEFDTPPGQKPTSPHQKLTSGTAQRPNSGVQVGAPLDCAYPRPSDGAPP